VWLTGLDETAGQVKFAGESNSLASVADYISALQRSGWFPTVDLDTSQVSGTSGNVVTFNLSGVFKDPEVAAKEAAAAAAAAAAAPPPPPGAPVRR
jgi:Tfp pilus assembly protein PilN